MYSEFLKIYLIVKFIYYILLIFLFFKNIVKKFNHVAISCLALAKLVDSRSRWIGLQSMRSRAKEKADP